MDNKEWLEYWLQKLFDIEDDFVNLYCETYDEFDNTLNNVFINPGYDYNVDPFEKIEEEKRCGLLFNWGFW